VSIRGLKSFRFAHEKTPAGVLIGNHRLAF
jgi:hypothetical protein